MISAPKRRCARSLIFLGLVALATATPGPWSDSAFAQDMPFEAVVTDEAVDVRAGPGRAYYVVDQLERGDRVRVVQTLYDWSKIEAPESSFSYISQAFVNARGDGSTGVVNSDRQEVKAGSLQGPGISYKTQVVLNRGDEVKILDTEGDYYKIEPPDNAYVYLPPGSLRPVGPADEAPRGPARRANDGNADRPREGTEAQANADDDAFIESNGDTDDGGSEPVASLDDRAEDPRALAEASTRPNETPGDDADTADRGVDGQVTRETDRDNAADPDRTSEPERAAKEDSATVTLGTEEREREPGDVAIDIAKGQELDVETQTTALAELEERAVTQLKKPVEEQPIEELLAAYRSLRDREDLELTPGERKLVSLRIAVLERNRQLREALARIEASQEVAQEEAEAPAAAEQADDDAATDTQPVDRATAQDFDAVGRLLASSVYDGQSLPRMYRLVDPTARRTLAYLAPADVDTTDMLGELVGVRGESRYDPSLKLRVFEVETIERLSGD